MWFPEIKTFTVAQSPTLADTHQQLFWATNLIGGFDDVNVIFRINLDFNLLPDIHSVLEQCPGQRWRELMFLQASHPFKRFCFQLYRIFTEIYSYCKEVFLDSLTLFWLQVALCFLWFLRWLETLDSTSDYPPWPAKENTFYRDFLRTDSTEDLCRITKWPHLCSDLGAWSFPCDPRCSAQVHMLMSSLQRPSAGLSQPLGYRWPAATVRIYILFSIVRTRIGGTTSPKPTTILLLVSEREGEHQHPWIRGLLPKKRLTPHLFLSGLSRGSWTDVWGLTISCHIVDLSG